MESLMTWSLAVLGYLGGVGLLLWSMQRVETGLDAARRVPIAAREQRRRELGASAAALDSGPASPAGWGR